jgi:LuxR family maltose regulon positive regulatory protein
MQPTFLSNRIPPRAGLRPARDPGHRAEAGNGRIIPSAGQPGRGLAANLRHRHQGFARVPSSDLDGGNTSFGDAVSAREQAAAHEVLAIMLCEQALMAMRHSRWSRAEILADQARTVFRPAGIEESYATPLVCAVQARAALHRGDVPAARRELVDAQRLRQLQTYAMPHIATQTRIELARVHLALGDLAGARTLIREIDELLRRRPDLGTLGDEAQALRARLSRERSLSASGTPALTAAELRLLPMLATHLTFPQIAAELFLSRHTVKSQACSVYRKLGASSRTQAVARSQELALLEG